MLPALWGVAQGGQCENDALSLELGSETYHTHTRRDHFLREPRGLEDLEERERWWSAGHTQIQVWDHSWLTPRLVCGFRFMRVPPGSSLQGGVFLPLAGMGMGADEILAAANFSGVVPKLDSTGKLMLWTFDGTEFQERALSFYSGGKPPMEDVWLLTLVLAVPASKSNNVLSGSHMMELQCSAMVLLASYLYAEYMAPLVPPAVLLKYFQHTWEVHSREGAAESASEMMSHFRTFAPLDVAMDQFREVLRKRREAYACAFSGSLCPQAVSIRPLVDVVIVRCQEDVSWVLDWLARVLRDEWTPEVAGLAMRLLVYEKCFSTPGSSEFGPGTAMTGQQLIDRLLHLGVLHRGPATKNGLLGAGR